VTITSDPAPPSGGAPEPSAPNSGPRRRGVLLLVAAVAVAALAIWWFAIRDDDDEGSRLPKATGSEQTIPPPATGAPDKEASALTDLLAKGRDRTFHATYKATGDPAVIGGDLTIEMWRKDGKVRQDTTTVRADQTIRTAGFVLGDGATITCSKADAQPWSCSPQPDPGTDEYGVFGSTADQLQGQDVQEAPGKVGDRDARCFTYGTSDGTGKLCVSDDGIPLSLSGNGQELTLTDLQESVDDGGFQPPATPGES
jgi:hypothetical protein